MIIGLVNCINKEIIDQSSRIEWINDPLFQKEKNITGLFKIALRETKVLLSKNGRAVFDVKRIGIAWPGPGNYKDGLLTATFIPGCSDKSQDIYSILKYHFAKNFNTSYCPEIYSKLDVNVRAHGEFFFLKKYYEIIPSGYGIVLNIATGIAGALNDGSKTLVAFKDFGDNYGQWGRFLIYNKITKLWRFENTLNGSIPVYNKAVEVRFTDLCGGPGIAGNYLKNSLQIYSDESYNDNNQRNIVAEKNILVHLNNCLFSKHKDSDYAFEIISHIGNALFHVSSAYQIKKDLDYVILTGGVGENYGILRNGTENKDVLVDYFKNIFPTTTVYRSKTGISSEIIGCSLIN